MSRGFAAEPKARDGVVLAVVAATSRHQLPLSVHSIAVSFVFVRALANNDKRANTQQVTLLRWQSISQYLVEGARSPKRSTVLGIKAWVGENIAENCRKCPK